MFCLLEVEVSDLEELTEEGRQEFLADTRLAVPSKALNLRAPSRFCLPACTSCAASPRSTG